MHPASLLTGLLEQTNEAYALAKIAGIKLCQAYRQQYGVNFVSGIPSNTFGPGDDFHPEDSHVIAALIRKVAAAKKNNKNDMENIPYIKIEAKNNYELGFKLGKRLKENIKNRLATAKRLYRKMGAMNFSKLSQTASKFLPATTKYFPELVTEVQALSEGAGVKLEELMVLMCEEEILNIKTARNIYRAKYQS